MEKKRKTTYLPVSNFEIKKTVHLKNWIISLSRNYCLKELWSKKISNPKINDFWRYFCRILTDELKQDYDSLILNKNIPKIVSDYFARCLDSEKKKQEKCNNINEVIINESQIIEENTEKKEGKIITKKDTILQKKISSVSFSSTATINTINRINRSTEFKEIYMKDFLYYHGGGKDDFELLPDGTKRKRLNDQLSHVQLSSVIKEDLKKLYNDFKATENAAEIKAINGRVNTLNKLIDSIRKIEFQPLDMFQQLSDDDFSSQKALNGAIINDKAMIDNGNIALEKGNKKVIEANTDQDIKKINNVLMDKHLETIAINNPDTIIIDAE